MQTARISPAANPSAAAAPALRRCCLITNGNSHRAAATDAASCTHPDVISEAMLPEIRTVALLIAASRHDFDRRSPAVFADEADWFAARIVLLRVRELQLDMRLYPMLQLANRRACAFAKQHRLPFQAARICPVLHSRRPADMLLMGCALGGVSADNVADNTRALRQQVQAMLRKIQAA